MLTDFLKLIQDTAVKAAGATVVKVPGDDRIAYLVNDGKVTHLDLPPPNRNHQLLSVPALVALASEHAEGAVFHNDEKVVLVLDSGDRREFATVKLEKSSAFSRLQQMAAGDSGGRAFTQPQLVRLLRHDLRNAGVDHVLASIRRVEFKRNGSGKGEVQHGRESMGRSVEAAVQGVGDIPEFFNATVPVYLTPGADFHKTVYCTLEIDSANERFVILPDADSLAAAINAAQADLQEALDGELEHPVYFGAP